MKKERETARFIPSPAGKRAKGSTVRNVWLEARSGGSLPDGGLIPEKLIAGGSRRIKAGMDAKFYLRNGPFQDSVALALIVKVRTDDDGQIRLLVIHPETGVVLHEYHTRRNGEDVK